MPLTAQSVVDEAVCLSALFVSLLFIPKFLFRSVDFVRRPWSRCRLGSLRYVRTLRSAAPCLATPTGPFSLRGDGQTAWTGRGSIPESGIELLRAWRWGEIPKKSCGLRRLTVGHLRQKV